MAQTVGDAECLKLSIAGKELDIAFKKWEYLDTRRNFINNELNSTTYLMVAAKKKLDEIIELTDLFSVAIKTEYESIVKSYESLIENFRLMNEKLEKAELEYNRAKKNFDDAEIVCDKIAAHDKY